MYAVRGRSWADATAIRTGGLVVDHEDVEGRAVDHDGAVDHDCVGCPQPLPFPVPAMVQREREDGGRLGG